MAASVALLVTGTAFTVTTAITAAVTTAATASAAPAGVPSDLITSTKHVATGAPLVFGYVNDDTGSAGAFPDETAATEATINYINNFLDGINGRPIKLYPCSDDGTPASASSCATQVLQHNPLAIIGGADFATSASIPLFQNAGKPYLGGIPFAGPENTSPLSFQFQGGDTADWGVQGMFAVQTLHAKRMSIIYPENGIAVTAAELSAEVAENLGMPKSAVQLVGQSPTAPDSTPAFDSAESNHPDVIIGITTGTQCLSLAEAHEELQIKASLILPGSCITDTQMGGGSKDAYANVYGQGGAPILQPATDNSTQIQLFLKILNQYSPKTSETGFAQIGFQTVMDIYSALIKLIPNDITTASIIHLFRNTTDGTGWLGPNYNCKNPPIKAIPAVCSVAAQMFQERNGIYTHVGGWEDAGPFIKTVPGIK
jgi:branched-chain amino acid transport system substrate-binding protein